MGLERAPSRSAWPGAGAAEWTGARLSETTDGAATIVYHSIVMHHLSRDERHVFETVLAEAGAVARDTAPVAWLRFEPGEESYDVSLPCGLTVMSASWRAPVRTATR
jgi:hypothetical protein